jgi:ribokinase
MSGNILIIGSINTDMVIKTKKFPIPGETILGSQFLMNPGGKGANQAVAAARLGGRVTFIGKVGNDVFGIQAKHNLQSEGINAEYIYDHATLPSGVALITVDGQGENTIVVAAGANASLDSKDIDTSMKAFTQADLVVLQLEIPLATVEYICKLAYKQGKQILLNPAPAQILSNELLQKIFVLTPNNSEAELLTGIQVVDEPSASAAASKIKDRGVKNVILTLGAAGAYLLSDSFSGMIASPKVVAIDTTAAGDVFVGGLAVALSEGETLIHAVSFANHAAALSVTRMGAQISTPFRKELMPEKLTREALVNK